MKAINFDRKELAAYILETAKESVLEKINTLIQKEENIVAFSSDGTPLTKEAYKKQIKKTSRSVANGAKTYTSDELENYVKNRSERT